MKSIIKSSQKSGQCQEYLKSNDNEKKRLTQLVITGNNFKWNKPELGFILISYRGAMSKLAYLGQIETPAAPRTRPLKLPKSINPSLHLHDNPEQLDLGEPLPTLRCQPQRRTPKHSILSFLEHRPKTSRKAKNLRVQ